MATIYYAIEMDVISVVLTIGSKATEKKKKKSHQKEETQNYNHQGQSCKKLCI
jgi:hypothetical protein